MHKVSIYRERIKTHNSHLRGDVNSTPLSLSGKTVVTLKGSAACKAVLTGSSAQKGVYR